MKKTLTLLLALFAIGVTSSVRAEDAFEFVRVNRNYPNIQINGMKIGPKTFKVIIQPNGYTIPYINGVKQSYPGEKEIKIINPSTQEVTRCYRISGWRADSQGSYTVTLDSPLQETDVVSLQIADDSHFYLGTAVYRCKSELKKEKEAEEALQKKGRGKATKTTRRKHAKADKRRRS